jgi:hypothetical protein
VADRDHPKTQYGLIALLASRRIMAEKRRRQMLANATSPREVQLAEQAKKDTKRSGWFR